MMEPALSPQLIGEAGPGAVTAREAVLGWMHDLAPYGIFTTDRDLRIQSWNHWLATHSGLTAEKTVGRFLIDLFPEVRARRLDEHFQRALQGEISVLSTALHKYLLPLPRNGPDPGVPFMLQTVRIAPLRSQDVTLGTITLIEDVTQRECQAVVLHRQQEHDRLLSLALGILLQSTNPLGDVAELFPKIAPTLGLEAYFNYLFDPETNMLRLNSAGGVSPRQKETMSALSLGANLCGRAAELRAPVLANQLQSSRDENARSLQTLGLRSYCCFPLVIGSRLLGTLSFASYSRADIAPDEVEFLSTLAQYVAIALERSLRENALRIAQRSLSEHAENLETKIAERTARLHETIAQLESFSYTVAHDLRAPIRSLKGYCEVLLSDYATAVPEAAAAILVRLERATSRLDSLTRDLLKFSKVARHDVQLGPVDLAELVQDIVLLTPVLQDAVIVHPPLGHVWAQRTLLQQCLANLFDNAVKFVPTGTLPRIVIRSEIRHTPASVHGGASMNTAFNPATRPPGLAPLNHRSRVKSGETTLPPSAARLRIWVEDNGIGVPPHAREKIFGIFERGSGLDHVEGTGIGLAIVARAVEQMQGACGVDSEVGKGSRFWLEFASVEPTG